MAEVNVYRVTYESRTNRGQWVSDTKNVLANGSAEAAIAKCRKAELGVSWTDEDTGKKYRITGFRLLGVERLVEVDVT